MNLKNMPFDFETDKIIEKIKKLKIKNKERKEKIVLLQFPDGLKKYAAEIAKEIEKKARGKKINCVCLIWLGSCFGACDVPNLGRAEKDIDLIVQFGHSKNL